MFALRLGQTHPATARLSVLLPESVAAILGALLLFVLPVSWRTRTFTLTWERPIRPAWPTHSAAGVSTLELALGATFGASMGFMMPISTPPNAIVYSSGYIPIGSMMRCSGRSETSLRISARTALISAM